MVGPFVFLGLISLAVSWPRESIPYRRLYRFSQRYNIFQIPINTGVPVLGLPLFFIFINKYINIKIYIYIYVCMYVCVCVCVCVCIIINIKVYHKTFPQFKTNYSWF